MSVILNSPVLMLYAITALLVAVGLARPVMWLCVRTGWVDKPDERKKHSGAVPLSGGLLILISVAITALIYQENGLDTGLVIAALIVFAVSFYDDRFPLRARSRFLAQLVASALLVFSSDAVVQQLGYCFGPVPVSLGILAIPFTMIAIPGLINAFNMVDGADGLSGGQLFSTVFWLIVVAFAVPILGTDRYAIDNLGPVLFPVAGALTAFMFFNMRSRWRQRAAMFLGDGGSMMLGLIIAWAIIRLSNHYGVAGFGAASALWLVAIPLFDLFSAIIRRTAEGKTPMSPDRKHMHHLLIQRGLNVSSAVLVMNLLAFVCGAIGVAAWKAEVPQYYLFWPLVVLFVVYTVYAHRFWHAHDQTLSHQQELFKTVPDRG